MKEFLLDETHFYLIILKVFQVLVFFLNYMMLYNRYKHIKFRERPFIVQVLIFGLIGWTFYIFLDILVFLIAPVSFSGEIIPIPVGGYHSGYPSLTIANILRDVQTIGATAFLYTTGLVPFIIRDGEEKIKKLAKKKISTILVIIFSVFLIGSEQLSVDINADNAIVDVVWSGPTGIVLLVVLIIIFVSAFLVRRQMTLKPNWNISIDYKKQVRAFINGTFFMAYGYFWFFVFGALRLAFPGVLDQPHMRFLIQFCGHTLWSIAPIFLYRGIQFPIELINPSLADLQRISAEKVRELVENSILGFFMSRDEVIISINGQTEEILEVSKDKLIGQNQTLFYSLFDPEDRSSLEQHYSLLSSAHNSAENIGIFRVKTPSGMTKWIRMYSGISTHNSIKLIQSVLLEMTEEKRLSEEILEEKRKAEEERLKSQKLESISLLAGGIAHDYNNLLTSILGNINLLQLIPTHGQEAIELLHDLENATSQAKKLTNQLLTFSKGGTPIKNPESIVKFVEESARFVLRGTKCNWKVSIGDIIPPVNIDRGQINQVLNNILINAGQAMPDGGTVKISCSLASRDEISYLPLDKRAVNEYVKIEITDKGKGIPKENQPRIFEPYYTTKADGNGLGLATAYSIILKHEGIITFKSEEGEGTTFSIFLPVGGDLQKEVFSNPTEDVPMSGNILIMDDNPEIQRILSKMCQKLGFNTEVCRDGTECIEKYRNALEFGNKYRVVIMDLTIPGGLGGKKTIEELIQIDTGTKAIVSSGYSHDIIIADYEKYHFRGILTKPYSLEKLKSELSRVLKT